MNILISKNLTQKTPPSKKGPHTKMSKHYLFELNTIAKHNLFFSFFVFGFGILAFIYIRLLHFHFNLS